MKQKQSNPSKVWLELFLIIISIFGFKSTFFGNFTVPTPSMVPNILVGDKLIANMMAYSIRIPFTNMILFKTGTPKVGDIIVFDEPKERAIYYVKRLIAVPGDIVAIDDGMITVNDKQYKITAKEGQSIKEILEKGGTYQESNGHQKYTVRRLSAFQRRGPDEPQLLKVPEGEYFFMGDNRDNSLDSRKWGTVPFDHIKGRASFIYYSSEGEPGWFTIPERIRWERFFKSVN